MGYFQLKEYYYINRAYRANKFNSDFNRPKISYFRRRRLKSCYMVYFKLVEVMHFGCEFQN